MKLFICWSGTRGRELAQFMQGWLGAVLGPPLEPFISLDIAKGAEWHATLSTHIARADAALVCLTPESRESSWMHYEAGSIAGKVGPHRVFTYLYRLRPEELSGPLSASQSTIAEQRETEALVRVLAKVMDDVRTPATGWTERLNNEARSRLTLGLAGISPWRLENVVQDFSGYFQRPAFDAPVAPQPGSAFFGRYTEVLEAHAALSIRHERVKRDASRFARRKYEELMAAVRTYAGTLQILATHAPATPDFLARSESARMMVMHMVNELQDEPSPPILDPSEDFALLGPGDETYKKMHIHRHDPRQPGGPGIDPALEDRLASSDWEFDRIVCYMHRENSANPRTSIDSARIESERSLARHDGPNHALNSALWTLRRSIERTGALLAPDIERDLRELLPSLRRIRPVADDIPAADLPGHIEFLEKTLPHA